MVLGLRRLLWGQELFCSLALLFLRDVQGTGHGGPGCSTVLPRWLSIREPGLISGLPMGSPGGHTCGGHVLPFPVDSVTELGFAPPGGQSEQQEEEYLRG